MFKKIAFLNFLFFAGITHGSSHDEQQKIELSFFPKKLNSVYLDTHLKSSALPQWKATGYTHAILQTPFGNFIILQPDPTTQYPCYTALPPSKVPADYIAAIDELLARSPLLVAALCRKSICSAQLSKAERLSRHEYQQQSAEPSPRFLDDTTAKKRRV